MCISCDDGLCVHPEVIRDYYGETICDGDYRACRFFQELKNITEETEEKNDSTRA